MAISTALRRILGRHYQPDEIDLMEQEFITVANTILAEDAATMSREENISGLSSAITLATECMTDYTAHIADGGAGISSAILLANDIKAKMNSHMADGATGLATVIALANDCKAMYNAHCADTGEHHTADSTNTIAAADASTTVTAIALITELLTDYDAHEGDAESGGAAAFHHAVEAGDVSLASTAAPTTIAECITRANDFKAKYNAHLADAVAHTNGTGNEVTAADAALGTGEHTSGTDITNTIAAADATDLASLVTLMTEELTAFDAHEGDSELASDWSFHGAQEAGDVSHATTAPTTYAECISIANTLKTKYNAHDADATAHDTGSLYQVAVANAAVGAGEHPAAADATNVLTAVVPTTLPTLITAVTDLLVQYDAHEGDSELAALWLYHEAGEAGDASLASAVAPTTLAECITRLNDWKAKFNTHDADATAHDSGSSYQIAASDSAYGAVNRVAASGVKTGDTVVFSILDDGTGNVTGVSAAVNVDDYIDFTFSADPQNDCIISYSVTR